MQLFKRILLSLFPEENAHQGLNPASMFISFISTKEFFSVINRKVVENYKLNLFDITNDPFEFTIWFGKNIQIKQQEIDNYYGYCAAANMNGYRFHNPANIGNSLSLVAAISCKDIFREYPPSYFLNFLYSLYLLSFVFTAKLKIFPYKDKQSNYNRFIEVFFNFYEFIFDQTGQELDKNQLENIKKTLIKKADILFLLFYSYQRFNVTLNREEVPSKEYYTWLLGDDIKKDDENLLSFFTKAVKTYTHSSMFTSIENKFLQIILPADILMRYLFLDTNVFLAVDTMIDKLFDKEKIEKYLSSFLKDDSQRESLIHYISNYKHFKKNFFQGVQKYIITHFQQENQGQSREEDMDELSSRIGDDNAEWEANEDQIKIPERIKKESKIMEKILNFYITFLWGFRIARGENYFLRIYKNTLLQDLMKWHSMTKIKEKTLQFYWGALYLYGKNIFYYKYISENVKQWRQRFYLPYKSSSKKTYSNPEIIKIFEESCFSTLLQDFNNKDLKIYSKTHKLLELFKKEYGKKISTITKKTPEQLIENIYSDLDKLLTKRKLIKTLQLHLNEYDLYHLKENLYTLDFWIHQSLYSKLLPYKKEIKVQFDDSAILGILAKARETLFGYLIFRRQIQKWKNNNQIEILDEIYIHEILHIETKENLTTLIENISKEFNQFLDIISITDDNIAFLKIWTDSRHSLILNTKNKNTLTKEISGEDILRLYGYLKNINYYNKRFLLPN